MPRRSFAHRLAIFLPLLLVVGPAAQAVPSRFAVSSPDAARSAAPSPNLRIVGSAGEDPPVVNERKKLKLRVVDSSDSTIQVVEWRSVDPKVGRVTKRGALKGVKFGVVTIQATTESGDVAQTTAIVARVRQPGDTAAQGDSKPDTAGNIYLTDPDRQVIYKSSGVVDSLFAGRRGEAGYRDGVGADARFNIPSGLGIDVRAGGGLFVADTGNNVVRAVSFSGRVRLAAGNAAGLPGTVTTDTTPLDAAAFRNPGGVASLGSNIFVADTGSHAIYFVDFAARLVHLVVGSPGEAGYAEGEGRAARFDTPAALAINSAGNLLAVADVANDRVRLVRLVPKSGGGYSGVVSTVGVASRPSTGRAPGGDGFEFESPSALGFDVADNLYVTSSGRAVIVTRTVDGDESRVLLAQTGSLAEPRNLSVRGTEVFVLDRRSQDGSRINIVDVGPPEIASVSPAVIRLAGGDELVIRGRNFPPETRVALGDGPVTSLQVVSSTEIRIVAPAQISTGARSLTVLTRGGVAQSIVQVRPLGLADVGPGDVVTVAGGAIPYFGDGGTVGDPNAVIDPRDLKLDAAGNMYFADARANRIRRVDGLTKVLTTIAGTGRNGYFGDGGLAVTADLSSPTGVAIDDNGNVYFSDTGNNRVRRVDAVTGIVTTVIGTGDAVPLEEPGLGTERSIESPGVLAIGADGLVYVNQNSRQVPGIVRYVPEEHQASFLALVLPDGAKASGFVPPALGFAAMAAGPDGALYVGLPNGRVVRVDTVTGAQTNFAGNGSIIFDGDGRVALETALEPHGLAFDADGNLFVSSHNRIRRIDAENSLVTTVGGTGAFEIPEPGDKAVNSPLGSAASLLLDGSNDIVVTLTDLFTERSSLWRIDARSGTLVAEGAGLPSELPELLATSGRLGDSVTLALDGSILSIADLLGGRVFGVEPSTAETVWMAGGGVLTGDGVPFGSARIEPRGSAAHPSGFLVSDGQGWIYRLDTTAGRLVTVAGQGVAGSSGDGGPALQALLSPGHIGVDFAGNIYVANYGGLSVRRIDAETQIITTVAGNGLPGSSGDGGLAVDARMFPDSIAVAPDGTLYIADRFGGIRRVDPSTGIITKLVDIRANVLAVDETGRLYAGSGNRVFRIDVETGIVTLIAGNGEFDTSGGDGGPAIDARIGFVTGLAIGTDGTVYFSDSVGGSVRAIKPAAEKR